LSALPAEQVEGQIREGKLSFTKKPTYTEKQDQQQRLYAHDHKGSFKKSRKSTFTVIEDYSPKEKVLALIESVERAVYDTQEMEASISAFLSMRNIRMQFYNETNQLFFKTESPTKESLKKLRTLLETCKSNVG
jgi:hypothetical protein